MLVKLLGEDTIPVMNPNVVDMGERDRFAQSLKSPLGHGMRSHAGMRGVARRMLDGHDHVEEAKLGSHHDAEIAGDDGLSMVVHKGRPVLRRNVVIPTAVETHGQILPYSA
jgi:hypothetical protein